MKITKYVHACLLAQTDEASVLFDPGEFSWNSGLFDIAALEKLDYIVITHEHFDHFHLPFVQALVAKFPQVRIISTEAVVHKLHEAGIANAACESMGPVHVFSTKQHADLSPLGETPENIAIHFADMLTVGGDRHDLEESKQILALTITAPWGSMAEAVKMALTLKPQKIVPVHDWHWNDEARSQAYARCEAFFKEQGITFIPLIDGQAVEV